MEKEEERLTKWWTIGGGSSCFSVLVYSPSNKHLIFGDIIGPSLLFGNVSLLLCDTRSPASDRLSDPKSDSFETGPTNRPRARKSPSEYLDSFSATAVVTYLRFVSLSRFGGVESSTSGSPHNSGDLCRESLPA